MSSYTSTTPVVLAVDRTTVGDSALPVPGRPYDHWRPHTCVRLASHVGGPVVRGREDVVARSSFVISFFPPWEDILEVPDEGAEDEVLCLAADPWWL
ncbi:hypothetical protein BHE74_00054366 [Ensete ventricosum]|nr:hypothetical protein BHE74_00054366 [Ensete ventricosum]